MAWKLTVINAIRIAAIPATANTHQLMVVRYAKSCSHECMIHHATGVAITNETMISTRKSFDKRNNRLFTDAPNTFLIPISLVR